MVRPWAQVGATCYCLDILNKNKADEVFPSGGVIHYIYIDLHDPDSEEYIVGLAPDLIFSFPPCTHLAVSGSGSFDNKLNRNPLLQQQEAHHARLAERCGNRCGANWMVENPVSVLSSLWRKPNFIFDPYEFGGYLPEDDQHPRWPKYIAPRDAYPKKTCLWTDENFPVLEKRPVTPEPGLSRQTKFLGGKSDKTKRIRSETPRGFSWAVLWSFVKDREA